MGQKVSATKKWGASRKMMPGPLRECPGMVDGGKFVFGVAMVFFHIGETRLVAPLSPGRWGINAPLNMRERAPLVISKNMYLPYAQKGEVKNF